LPRDVSAYVTLTNLKKKKLSNGKINTTTEKNVPYSVVENTSFSIKRDNSLSSRNTNRYRICICTISESNRQKLTSQSSIHTSSLLCHVCVPSFRLLWLSLYGPHALWERTEVPYCLQRTE
jgi:hypothetical protein